MHLGQAGHNSDFPFSLHTAAEVRGARLTVGNQVIHDGDRLAAFDDPRVRAVAARYPDRPGLDGTRWLYG